MVNKMGLYQLFKDVFYETMTAHGFVHQRNAFLRINGDVLQAVTVKPITSYEFTCAVFPIFAAEDLSCYFRRGELGSKPYWAEMNSLSFGGYEGFPFLVRRCQPNMLEPYMNKEPYLDMTVANLEKAAELMPAMYLDKFDKIRDLDTYLDWYTSPLSGLRVTGHIPCRVLGCKAYYDGNFEYGRNFIDNMRVVMLQKSREHAEKSRKYIETVASSFDEYLNEQLAHVEKVISECYDEFFSWEKENDLSWVPAYVENGRERTLSILKLNYSKLFK